MMDSSTLDSCLNQLEQHDPQTAQKVATTLAARAEPIADKAAAHLVQTLVWTLTQTPVLVITAADGFIQLLADNTAADTIATYANRILEAGRHGPAFANLMAHHLPRVLQAEDKTLLKQFDQTVTRLHQIGAYTLTPTLKIIPQILAQEDSNSAKAYLKLLIHAFSHHMTYNRSVRFCHVIPKGVAGFEKNKRPWQIDQMTRAIKTDLDLGDAFLEGIKNGLNRLTPNALAQFVTFGIKQWRKQPQRGMRALALASQESRSFLQQLSTSATLRGCREEISRYLRARLGRSIPLRPLDQSPQKVDLNPATQICTDGTTLYLPDEIDIHLAYDQNHDHMLMLARLEAGLLEFGTFDFDRKLFLQNNAQTGGLSLHSSTESDFDSDLEWFVESFFEPLSALNLFILFEHGRLRLLTHHRYPGLYRRITPYLTSQMDKILEQTGPDPLHLLYAHIAVGIEETSLPLPRWTRVVSRYFRLRISLTSTVEDIASLVATVYPYFLNHHPNWNRALITPYGRSIFPQLHSTACRIKITPHQGRSSRLQPGQTPDLRKTANKSPKVSSTASGQTAAPAPPDLSTDATHHFRYPEWRADIYDYLPSHTCVVEQNGPLADTDFYAATLERHRPLVRYIRRAFEQMRPQQLNILRPWKEGDAFDLTQLTEYAISRRMRQSLPERLYIKRIKSDRSVAVQLLVDLSRSTANPSHNSHRSVLEIEKEALVLFCEALQTLGDAFAIAGFSGKGRQQVYFRHIKRFDEPLNKYVHKRISAIAPIQATRMGAAVRHAAFRLKEQPAKVRLLIILGDGFPNDIDYKKEIAIADTRKAIQKSAANNIHVHGITVNMAADPQLNDLYGPRHSIITDVRDLPTKLLRIYRQLTL